MKLLLFHFRDVTNQATCAILFISRRLLQKFLLTSILWDMLLLVRWVLYRLISFINIFVNNCIELWKKNQSNHVMSLDFHPLTLKDGYLWTYLSSFLLAVKWTFNYCNRIIFNVIFRKESLGCGVQNWNFSVKLKWSKATLKQIELPPSVTLRCGLLML